MAKSATVVPVQVLEDLPGAARATGPMSLLLLALDWVLADCLASGQRCVLNLSFGGRFSGDLLGWFSIPESALSALEVWQAVLAMAARDCPRLREIARD